MSQDYLIAIDPVFDLSAESFTAVWNNQPDAGDIGLAEPTRQPPGTFFAEEAAVALLTVANSIAAGILANLLTDLLKEKFGVKETETTIIERPDGQTIIIKKP